MDHCNVSDRNSNKRRGRRQSHPTRLALVLCVLAVGTTLGVRAQEAPQTNDNQGNVRLTRPTAALRAYDTTQPRQETARTADTQKPSPRPQQRPGEFEIYVNKLQGLELQEPPAPGRDPFPAGWIRRLGTEAPQGETEPQENELGRQAGPDYVLGSGDEVQVTLWGSVDGDFRQTVDRAGRITIPRVGPVLVAGIRYGDLSEVIRARVGQVFKNFQVSATLGKLRSLRVYVTGFTAHPGAYMVSGLATIASAVIKAGGPSSAGSFRNIELRRGGKLLSRFDYYDLLLKGDQASDRTLQADDVIYIGPVGAQVAMLGSVNKPSILELRAGETTDDVLSMAGGLSAVADRSRLELQRLSDRNDRRSVELRLPGDGQSPVNNGDVFHAFSAVSATLPQYKQYKRIRVEGEVARPGDYVLPPASTLVDAILAAGGLTPQAYVFGTEFTRESTRKTQQENYERALRDMEAELTRSTSTQKALSADEAAVQSTRAAGISRLVERLRAARPNGRIVLQISADSRELPPLAIEDADRLSIPTVPSTVGVFGSVFNAGSYLITGSSSIDDILKQAGGPMRGADVSSVFVLRANGSVISSRQSNAGWIGGGSGVTSARALPGDTIFVPEEMNKTTFVQEAKEWTQILYQFGLGAAALKTIRN